MSPGRPALPPNTLGAVVREARVRLGYTQEQAGKAAGHGRAWLDAVESGRIKRPDRDSLQRLAPVLNLPVVTLYEAAGWPTKEPRKLPTRQTLEHVIRELQAVVSEDRRSAIRLRRIEERASAGASAGTTDYGWAADGADLYLMTVSGSCMEPLIMSGQEVIVDPDRTPKDGDIVAADHAGELVVKKYVIRAGAPLLVAEDETIIRPNGDTRVLGVVVRKLAPPGDG